MQKNFHRNFITPKKSKDQSDKKLPRKKRRVTTILAITLIRKSVAPLCSNPV